MSDDLHTRLRTAIVEMLALAKRLHDAAPGSWTVESGKYFWLLDGDGDRLAEVGHVTDAEFIAAHDPVWAIRQHEAALRVLAEHAPLTSRLFLPPMERCAYEWGDGDGWPVAWAECPAIARLADAYGVKP